MTAGSTAQQDREAHKDELKLMLFVSSPAEVLVSNAPLRTQHGLTNLHQLRAQVSLNFLTDMKGFTLT